MLQRVPLHDWHVSHKARMVEFGGWEMPIQYQGIPDEHQIVRNEVGLFDVSHMARLNFAGEGALDLLQHVCSNDAASMKDFQVRYNLICNENGGILDDVLVYRWPYGWSMVVNASNRQKILDWLEKHKDTRNVEIEDRTLETCMIAVQGPQAIEICKELVDTNVSELKYYFAAPTQYQGQACIVSRTGYTGEDGLEIIVGNDQAVTLWEDLIERGGKACGLGARDTLRLEAGMPLYGHELTEEIDPFQAGLQWAVKLSKGDWLSREALEKRKEQDDLRQRIGLELGGRRIAREGTNVVHDGKTVGVVTSGTFSPTLQKSIAMAYVDADCTEVGTQLSVDLRGKEEPATVVKLPFYKRPKKS